MRRLLSPVRLLAIHTSRRRGRTPVAIPAAPADFSRLLPPLPDRGAGALPQLRPSPLFTANCNTKVCVRVQFRRSTPKRGCARTKGCANARTDAGCA
jgi:hypothetical protein